MKSAVRLIVAALILASIGFGIYYYFSRPLASLSTYNEIYELESASYSLSFDSEISKITSGYTNQSAVTGYSNTVYKALNNNYNYYKSFSMYANNVNSQDQSNLHDKIKSYSQAVKTTYDLAKYFNDHSTMPEYEKMGMYNNFIVAYNNQIKEYALLVEELKQFVIRYSFNNLAPVNLKNTLIEVQLDFAKVAITKKLDIPTEPDTLTNELQDILNKYNSLIISPEGTNTSVLSFISSYNNLENKSDYLGSYNKVTYIASLSEDQEAYANSVNSFLNRSSYN